MQSTAFPEKERGTRHHGREEIHDRRSIGTSDAEIDHGDMFGAGGWHIGCGRCDTRPSDLTKEVEVGRKVRQEYKGAEIFESESRIAW